MFERYTESARRTIFFARYEASQFGSTTIESEHFLLGLLREGGDGLESLLGPGAAMETIRKTIQSHIQACEKVSAAIDLPLSSECKRILTFASEESEQLHQTYVGGPHLVLGILRERNCYAATVLIEMGLDLDKARSEVSQMPAPSPEPLPGLETLRSGIDRAGTLSRIPKTPMPEAGVVPDAETAKRIAVAVWTPRISSIPDDSIMANTANLMHDVWIVTGSYTSKSVACSLTAFIQKEDGKILRAQEKKAAS